MEIEPKYLTEFQAFERLLERLFMPNNQAEKSPPWEATLVIDSLPVVFPELPYFEFTRRSPKRLAELKDTGEYYAYCTPGNAKKLKEALGYEKFLAVKKQIEFPGLKMLPPETVKDAVPKQTRPEYFIPLHPEYRGDSLREVWQKAQRICPRILDSKLGPMEIPADIHAAVAAAILSLSQQGFEVGQLNIFRALLREAELVRIRSKSTREIIQLYGEREVSPDFRLDHEDGHRQFPEGNKRQKARDLIEFADFVGDGFLDDFNDDLVAKYERYVRQRRKQENKHPKRKKRKP